MTLEVHGRNMPIGPRSGGGCSPAGWIAVLAAAWLSMTATGLPAAESSKSPASRKTSAPAARPDPAGDDESLSLGIAEDDADEAEPPAKPAAPPRSAPSARKSEKADGSSSASSKSSTSKDGDATAKLAAKESAQKSTTTTAKSAKAAPRAKGIELAQATDKKADSAPSGKAGRSATPAAFNPPPPAAAGPSLPDAAAAAVPAGKAADTKAAPPAKSVTVNGKVERSATAVPPPGAKSAGAGNAGPAGNANAATGGANAGGANAGGGNAPGNAQRPGGGNQARPGAGNAAGGNGPPANAAAAAAGGQGGASPGDVRFEPTGQKGQAAYMSEGQYLLFDILKHLSNYTGLPLLISGGDPNLATRTIQVVNDIPNVDEDIVKALLEVNGFTVQRDPLPSTGKEILKVVGNTPAAGPQNEEEKEQKIIDADRPVERGEAAPAADEFATMIFTMKYTSPRDASEALNNLVSSRSGGGGAGAPGAAAVARGTKTFSMVEVKNTQMLIVKAKFRLLNYIKELLKLIDQPIKEPDRIIKIIDVQDADAQDLVTIIQEFLGTGRGGAFGSRGGLGGRSRLGRTGSLGTNTAAPTPPTPGGVSGAQGQNDYQTVLIPDVRTNKLIVETYSQQELNDIEMLVDELDIRFDLRRLRTHIYQVRYLLAAEVAADLQSLLGGFGGGTMSGLRRGGAGTTGRTTGSRLSSAAQRPTSGRSPISSPTGGAPGQQQGASPGSPLPSLIVPHEPTNSLLIQAEPEEYDEILNILSKIDTKRRQVFIEAALVQVSSASNLNYTIELLAGNPDDHATRALFASSFNLTGIDFQNFQRVIPDISDPAAVPAGGILAIMNRGKLPAIVRFFKSNRDSQVLATPFVLADDNKENVIEIKETRFVQTTNTVNTATTTSQQGEDAGIRLSIFPTISSQQAVLLQMELEVSEFAEAVAAAATLPPKSSNTITSEVTIPDGEVFVVGGLTRLSKSKSVSKVPLLGDIPLIGKLFRSESTAQSQNNLYMFLQAHILTDEEFRDGEDLTQQAMKKMRTFDPSLNPTTFQRPNVERRPPPEDEEAKRIRKLNPSKEGTSYHREGNQPRSNSPGRRMNLRDGNRRDGEEAAPIEAEGTAPRDDTGDLPPTTARRRTRAPASPQKVEDHDGWLLSPSAPASAVGSGSDSEEDSR